MVAHFSVSFSAAAVQFLPFRSSSCFSIAVRFTFSVSRSHFHLFPPFMYPFFSRSLCLSSLILPFCPSSSSPTNPSSLYRHSPPHGQHLSDPLVALNREETQEKLASPQSTLRGGGEWKKKSATAATGTTEELNYVFGSGC